MLFAGSDGLDKVEKSLGKHSPDMVLITDWLNKVAVVFSGKVEHSSDRTFQDFSNLTASLEDKFQMTDP